MTLQRRVSLICLALLPSLVIVFGLPGQIYPFGGTKTFFFIGLMTIVILVSSYRYIRLRGYRSVSFGVIDVLFLAIVIGMTITSMFGIDPHLSFFGSFDFGVSVMLWWCVFVYYMLLKQVFQKDSDLKKTLLWAIVGAGIITVIGIWLSYTESSKAVFLGGFEGNSSLAGYVILFAVASCVLLFEHADRRQKILLGSAAVFLILNPLYVEFGKGVQIGDARGILLASCGAAVVTVGFWLLGYQKQGARIFGKILLAISVLGFVFIGMSLARPDSFPKRVFVEHGGANRLVFWSIAKDASMGNILLGHGTGTFQYSFFAHFDPALYYTNSVYEGWTDKPHNALIELIHDNGIIVLLLYSAVLSLTYRRLYQLLRIPHRTHEAVVLFFVLTAYILQNMLVFDGTTSVVLFGVLLVLIWYGSPTPYTVRIPRMVSFVAIPLCIGVLYVCSLLPFVEGYRLYRASKAPLGERGTALSRAFSTSNAGGIASSGYSANRFLGNCVARTQVDCTTDIVRLSEGISREPQATFSIPAHLFQANAALYLYERTHQQSELGTAIKEATTVTELAPFYPEGYWALAHAQYLTGNPEAALVAGGTVITIDPNIREAYTKMIFIARLVKQPKTVVRVMQQAEARFPGFVEEMALQ